MNYIHITATIDDLEALLRERENFENYIYDNLILSDSFWEPVKVCFENVKDLKDIIGEDTCCICTDTHLNFKNLNCCNQKMCNGCCYSWFEKSVNCPYCYQDLRKFDLKNKKLINENE